LTEASFTPPRLLPWTRSCFVCGQDNPKGLQLRSRWDGQSVTLDYVPRPEDVGWAHIVHGGITMALLDEVMTWAAIVEVGRICVAAEMTTRLRKTIEVNRKLRVVGKVTGGKSRLLLTEGTVLDTNGEVLVSATGKYVTMSPDQAEFSAADFVISPESIHPDQILR